jgi:16S rRNA (cytosine967-C5)-methyltransferase
VLPEENDDAVEACLARSPQLSAVPAEEVLAAAALGALSESVRRTRFGLQMSPLRTGTDGFYVAMLHCP